MAEHDVEHGGRLHAAAKHYGIAPAEWLDLSTGIAPWSWPAPPLPTTVWQRLPEPDDGLEAAATQAYGNGEWLAVPGSQAAIQCLPRVLGATRVACTAGSYAGHAAAWEHAGVTPTAVADEVLVDAADTADVLVVVNPDNPTGRRLDADRVSSLHARIARRGGWLVVDEAFADAEAHGTVATLAGRPGLVVLRSLGKFYGLAGLRLGFVGAPTPVREAVDGELGPWAVSHPARWLGARALADRRWRTRQRRRLAAAARRLDDILRHHRLPPAGGTPLFRYVPHAAPRTLAAALARRAILVRTFDDPPALRFGLPGTAGAWRRLDTALGEIAT